jgi:hypothetical protein
MWFNAVVADVRHSSRNIGKASTKTIILAHTLLVQTAEPDACGDTAKGI